eukprot:g3571.t1
MPKTRLLDHAQAEENTTTYFDCTNILDALIRESKIEGNDGKNMIGQYKNSDVYEWDKIKSAYEASNLHVAEASRALISMCKYEIPSRRKDLEDSKKKLVYTNERVENTTKMIENASSELVAVCKEVGISTEGLGSGDARSQIEDRILRAVNADRLRESLQQVRAKVRLPKVIEACDFYCEFRRFLRRRSVGAGGHSSKVSTEDGSGNNDDDDCLLVLRRLQLEDEPDSLASFVDSPPKRNDLSLSGDGGGIDWGDVGGTDDAAVGIDIDWGIEEEEEEMEGNSCKVADSSAVEIDWGIETTSNAGGDDGMIEIGDPSSMGGGGVTVDDESGDANTVVASLADPAFRGDATNDIFELIAFLEQRVKELKSHTAMESEFLFEDKADVSKCVRYQDASNISAMLVGLYEARSAIMSENLRDELSVASSKHFRERFAERITTIRRRSVKLKDGQIKHRERQRVLSSKIEDLESKCVLLVKTAKSVREKLAALVSGHLKGRGVKIIGTRL